MQKSRICWAKKSGEIIVKKRTLLAHEVYRKIRWKEIGNRKQRRMLRGRIRGDVRVDLVETLCTN